MHRVESAFRGTRPQSRPGPGWLGDPLEVSEPETLQLEEIAEKSARAVANDNHVRLGDTLQARSAIWCLANHGLLLGDTFTDHIAHNHGAGGNPDTDLKRRF